jgi:uncharacterized lipoprotein YmbA
MSFISRAIPFALAFVLTACASSPVHYYTMLPPAHHESAGQQPASFLVDVLPVDVPSQIDQSALVVRDGDSGVTVLDSERWASPLGDEIRSALSSELAILLNTQDVAGLPTIQSSKPVVTVKVQIRRFDVWPGQRVQISADWELTFANGPGIARVVRMGHVDEPASGGYPGVTLACQRAVMNLTARIASDASTLANSR